LILLSQILMTHAPIAVAAEKAALAVIAIV
jgi:hypothetical protein